MKYKLVLLSTLLSIALFLSSCDEEDSLNKTVLTKIVFHENVDQIGNYEYASNGRMKRYSYSFNGKVVEYTDYAYIGAGLASKKTYQLANQSNSFTLVRTDEFSYDAEGKMSEANYYSNGKKEAIYTFTWQNGRLKRLYRTTFSTFGESLVIFSDLEYDSKGNVSKATYYNNNGLIPELSFIVEYEYDDKINPLYLTEPLDYETRNPNNIVKMTQRSSPDSEAFAVTTNTYIYDGSGLPTEKTEVITLFGAVSEKNNKFYYKKI